MEDKTHCGHEWFVMVYKLPLEPTRYRASVCRKLKGAGAVYLQNGVVALPADPVAERMMRGVAQEIRESDGIACLLRGEEVVDESGLTEAFAEARDAEYSEVMKRCREDLEAYAALVYEAANHGSGNP